MSTEFVVEDVEPLAGDALVRLASLMDHSPGQQTLLGLATLHGPTSYDRLYRSESTG